MADNIVDYVSLRRLLEYHNEVVLPAISAGADTKNTAGATNSSSKLFLIGATAQGANPQTYSQLGVFAQNGRLFSNNSQVVNLDDTQTIAGSKVFTNVLKIQNGSAAGAFLLGADVNAKTLTVNTRKLGRLGIPAYNSNGGIAIAGISLDSQASTNFADFGGHVNNTSSVAPDVIRFIVAATHNNAVSASRITALTISNQDNLPDVAGGGTSVKGIKAFLPIIAEDGITGDLTGTASNSSKLNNQSASYYLNYDNFTNTPTSLPASDVYAWAKSATKPSYSYSEINNKPDLSVYALAENIPTKLSQLTNDASLATESFVSNAIAALVDSSPGTLDTLNELAAALGDDPNFATTVTNLIATKLSLDAIKKLTIKMSNGTTVGEYTPTTASTLTIPTIAGEQGPQGPAGKDGEDGMAIFINGTGSTAGTWLGSSTEITEYYTGLTILYRPAVAGASTTTLNINSLGAKRCYRNNADTLTTHYPAGSVILFVYDETLNSNAGGWRALADYDSTEVQSLRPYYALFYTGANPLYGYKICGEDAQGRIQPLTITSGTGTTKTVNTVAIKPNKFYWYSGSATVAANSVVSHATLYIARGTSGANYTFNSNITTYKEIYLKGIYSTTTGLFTLDNSSATSWYVQVPYNSTYTASTYFSSAYQYIYLGRSYSSNNYMYLEPEHQMYEFDGTNLKPYTSGSSDSLLSSENHWTGEQYFQHTAYFTNSANITGGALDVWDGASINMTSSVSGGAEYLYLKGGEIHYSKYSEAINGMADIYLKFPTSLTAGTNTLYLPQTDGTLATQEWVNANAGGITYLDKTVSGTIATSLSATLTRKEVVDCYNGLLVLRLLDNITSPSMPTYYIFNDIKKSSSTAVLGNETYTFYTADGARIAFNFTTAATDTTTSTGTFYSTASYMNINPMYSSIYDLGSASTFWRNVYASTVNSYSLKRLNGTNAISIPDEAGTLATREWVTNNTGGSGDADLLSNANTWTGSNTFNNSIIVNGDFEFKGENSVTGIKSRQGYRATDSNGSLYTKYDYGAIYSGAIGNVKLTLPTAAGTLATQEWVQQNAGGATITVDTELSETSENPVQNKVITAKFTELENQIGSGGNNTQAPTPLKNGDAYPEFIYFDTSRDITDILAGLTYGEEGVSIIMQLEELLLMVAIDVGAFSMGAAAAGLGGYALAIVDPFFSLADILFVSNNAPVQLLEQYYCVHGWNQTCFYTGDLSSQTITLPTTFNFMYSQNIEGSKVSTIKNESCFKIFSWSYDGFRDNYPHTVSKRFLTTASLINKNIAVALFSSSENYAIEETCIFTNSKNDILNNTEGKYYSSFYKKSDGDILKLLWLIFTIDAQNKVDLTPKVDVIDNLQTYIHHIEITSINESMNWEAFAIFELYNKNENSLSNIENLVNEILRENVPCSGYFIKNGELFNIIYVSGTITNLGANIKIYYYDKENGLLEEFLSPVEIVDYTREL